MVKDIKFPILLPLKAGHPIYYTNLLQFLRYLTTGLLINSEIMLGISETEPYCGSINVKVKVKLSLCLIKHYAMKTY
jgi:hypothetical protein